MTMDLMMFALIFSICREESVDQSQSANPQVQGERQVRAKQLLEQSSSNQKADL